MTQLSPIMISPTVSCPFVRLNGVEPLAWLTDVLERMVSGRAKANELERLLPWNWQAERVGTELKVAA